MQGDTHGCSGVYDHSKGSKYLSGFLTSPLDTAETDHYTAVLTTLVQTHTLIVVPRTVTAPCNGATRTVTVYPQTPTVVVTSTATRTETDGQVTRYWTTTASETASCHYPSSWSPSTNNPAPTASWCPRRGGCDPSWGTGGGSSGGGGGGGGWGWWTRWGGNADPTALDNRGVAATAAAAAVAAVTSTYTQTTYTVTRTIVTTIAGQTTTELGEVSQNHLAPPSVLLTAEQS